MCSVGITKFNKTFCVDYFARSLPVSSLAQNRAEGNYADEVHARIMSAICRISRFMSGFVHQ